jgi:hypothetical protein
LADGPAGGTRRDSGSCSEQELLPSEIAAELGAGPVRGATEDWEHTMDRHARLGEHAIVTLHFTPHKLRTEQAFVITKLRNGTRRA